MRKSSIFVFKLTLKNGEFMKSRYKVFFASSFAALLLLASTQVQAADLCTPKLEVFFDPAAGQYVNVFGEVAKSIYNSLSYPESVSGDTGLKTDPFSPRGSNIECMRFINDDQYRCTFHSTNY